MRRAPVITILDQDAATRHKLEAALRSRQFNIASYASAADFRVNFDPEREGCVLLELCLPTISNTSNCPDWTPFGGLDVQQELALLPCPPAIIMICRHVNVAVAVQAMRLGSIDVLEKPLCDDQLLKAVNLALRHDQQNRQVHAKQRALAERLAELTQSEHEVLALLSEGFLNKEIAAQLDLGIRTVELRRSRIFAKLGVDSLSRLIRLVVNTSTPRAQRTIDSEICFTGGDCRQQLHGFSRETPRRPRFFAKLLIPELNEQAKVLSGWPERRDAGQKVAR